MHKILSSGQEGVWKKSGPPETPKLEESNAETDGTHPIDPEIGTKPTPPHPPASVASRSSKNPSPNNSEPIVAGSPLFHTEQTHAHGKIFVEEFGGFDHQIVHHVDDHTVPEFVDAPLPTPEDTGKSGDTDHHANILEIALALAFFVPL